MPQQKYRIYELSARAVISHAREVDGVYRFHLNQRATERCKSVSALHEQDDNALFFQTMCVLHGGTFTPSKQNRLVEDLADVIFYMNFENIFDRSGTAKYMERQRKAKDMFRPEGVCLNFGSGEHHYLAFERSGSMSRQARLSFIRADVYEEVRRRIMLDMKIEWCQLSKLYAYNGLMLSSGMRIDGVRIEKRHRVIVIDNPTNKVEFTPIITVRDDGSNAAMRKYHREETIEDITTTCFDGVGLISKEYAAVIDKVYCGQHIHTSFQIRMPYVKGMLHQVDFKDFFKRTGTKVIKDIWGKNHPVESVDIILTKSQFKGYGWLRDNRMTWEDYWKAFSKYNHALYITNVSKEKPETHTELNYQFLSTVSMEADEFRPADLPDGWKISPASDPRHWLTKETELAYYNFCADEQFRRDYFLESLSKRTLFNKSREYILASVLQKNPLFIHEPIYTKQLNAAAEKILKQYSVGRLIVAGDNRYLSGDLFALMRPLVYESVLPTPEQRWFYQNLPASSFAENSFFAPGAAYTHGDNCTLLRNPHIARNEELQLSVYPADDELRNTYLGHLTDVVMVSAESLAAERLGGADYDGDMIKTISDPILNACVRKNYQYEQYGMLSNAVNLPFLKIPALSSHNRDANDWHARFEVVRDTFSSRVGQICNAALDRSIIAYNENSDAEEKRRCQRETETLAILTGLEIDAAKTGIRPDLTEYLGTRTVKRTAFLQYKKLIEDAEERRAWYEPTHQQKLKAFFDKTDWEQVDSHVERLPYLALQLKKNTPKIKPRPAEDSELFAFAQKSDWKDRLDRKTLSSVSALLKDYEACLSRIRACRVPIKDQQRKRDIERILYSRGQEDIYDADELYALFQQMEPERISELRQMIRAESWHLMDETEREAFLTKRLPEAEDYYDLLSDFRHGGYRILGDLVCDVDDENTARERKYLYRETDSAAFTAMMRAYAEKPLSETYRAAVSRECRRLLKRIVRPGLAIQYVVALGKRDLLWDLLIDQIESNVLVKEA